MTLSAQSFVSIILVAVLINLFLLCVAYLTLLERKLASWVQDRIGPNRVGFTLGFLDPNRPRHFGLAQPIADGLKMLLKEDYNPRGVDRALFYAAPVFAVVPALLGWAVLPFGGVVQVPEMNLLFLHITAGTAAVAAAPLHVGVIFILATGSLAVYGVVVGGWSSNNKYAFLGGLRATAQMLSYEIPMGLIVLCMLLMAGSSYAGHIASDQAGYWWGIIPQWNIVQQPIAAIIFFTCLLAENNRAPFDLAECEQELVAGFHTEYSSMKFALFFLGEYMHMVTAAGFFTLLFLGGWHLPFLDYLFYGAAQPEVAGVLGMLLKILVFLAKMFVCVWFVIQIRWTIPRFRFDQLMQLAWRCFIPLSLLLLLITGTMTYFHVTEYLWLANIAVVGVILLVSPWFTEGLVANRRVGLAGSRFSPAS